MEKICEILIKTGRDKFIPVGTARIKLIFGWDEIVKKETLIKTTLKKIDLNIKKGEILWEAKPDIWISD